jgi:hypothetical protein
MRGFSADVAAAWRREVEAFRADRATLSGSAQSLAGCLRSCPSKLPARSSYLDGIGGLRLSVQKRSLLPAASNGWVRRILAIAGCSSESWLTTHLAQQRTFSDVRFRGVTWIGRVTVMGAKRDGISVTQSAALALGRRELRLAVNASCQEAGRRLRGVESSVASYVNDKCATVEFSKKPEGVMTRRVSGCAYARTGGE